MPTEADNFIAEEYATPVDQLDGSIEDVPLQEATNQEPHTFESKSDIDETADNREPAEFIEPGKQAVIDQKGGPDSWEFHSRGDSGYWFDGEQARDPEGNVWTNEDVDLHEEMLAQWREGGNSVFFLPDYTEQTEEGEVLYVTMLIRDENGRITYEIYSCKTQYPNLKEEMPIPKAEEDTVEIYSSFWSETSGDALEPAAPEPVVASLGAEHAQNSVVADAHREEPTTSIPDSAIRIEHTSNNLVPEVSTISATEAMVQDASLNLVLTELFRGNLLQFPNTARSDSVQEWPDLTNSMLHEPISSISAPVATPTRGINIAPPVSIIREPMKPVELEMPEPHVYVEPRILKELLDGPALNLPDIAKIVAAETPDAVSAEHGGKMTNIFEAKTSFIDTVDKVIVQPIASASNFREPNSATVDVLPIVASQMDLSEPLRTQPVVSNHEPRHAQPVLKSADIIALHPTAKPMSEASREVVGDKYHEHKRSELAGNAPFSAERLETGRRTPLHGNEILTHALRARISSPHPIDNAYASRNAEILQITNSKSPRYAPISDVPSSDRVVRKRNGIIMRRAA